MDHDRDVTELIMSNGGPLIMIEERLLPSWGGIENIGGLQSGVRGSFMSGSECDYHRACAIKDWIGVVQIRDGTGVIFSGDHLALGLKWIEASRLLVVRPWYHMEDLNERLRSILTHLPAFEFNFDATVGSERLTFFDSAYPGFDLLPPTLTVSVQPGRFAVSTGTDAMIRDIEITLHLIEWMT
jgi:hypothetical protein